VARAKVEGGEKKTKEKRSGEKGKKTKTIYRFGTWTIAAPRYIKRPKGRNNPKKKWEGKKTKRKHENRQTRKKSSDGKIGEMKGPSYGGAKAQPRGGGKVKQMGKPHHFNASAEKVEGGVKFPELGKHKKGHLANDRINTPRVR